MRHRFKTEWSNLKQQRLSCVSVLLSLSVVSGGCCPAPAWTLPEPSDLQWLPIIGPITGSTGSDPCVVPCSLSPSSGAVALYFTTHWEITSHIHYSCPQPIYFPLLIFNRLSMCTIKNGERKNHCWRRYQVEIWIHRYRLRAGSRIVFKTPVVRMYSNILLKVKKSKSTTN